MSEGSSRFQKTFDLITQAGDVQRALQIVCENYDIAHVTYHMAQTIATKFDAPFVRTTYPPDWVSQYLIRGYVLYDPIVKEGFERALPFHWDEVEPTPKALEILTAANKFGLGQSGYSIPVVDKSNRRSLFSINSHATGEAWLTYLDENRQDWVEIAHHIHKCAIREMYGEDHVAPHLSRRELECLTWSARGKDYKDIAIILNISEHTARGYLKSARYKLDCANIPQAVSKAITLRLINPLVE